MTSSYPALVLNADFSPVSIFPLSLWDFARTMRNTLKGSVIVLETYDAVLRSPSITYQPPSVVALKNYVRISRRVAFTRMNLFLRDNFKCQYCEVKLTPRDLTFDHIIPRSAGGGTNWENIVAACVKCNTLKGSRRDMTPIRKPAIPTGREMARKRPPKQSELHHSWMDYLYWSGVLHSD